MQAAQSFQLFEPIQFAERAPLRWQSTLLRKVGKTRLHFGVTQLLRLKGKVSDRTPVKRPGHAAVRGWPSVGRSTRPVRCSSHLESEVRTPAASPLARALHGRAPDLHRCMQPAARRRPARSIRRHRAAAFEETRANTAKRFCSFELIAECN
jgi:hypothetical protein